MAARSSDPQADRLYQLPPDDFTRERNALAKEIGGEEGKRIKSLPKPSASAWAVNQLYWRDRSAYEALVAASEHLRAAHRTVLAGRNADLRAADARHREAVNSAIASTLRFAKEGGQNVSSATQMEIARTLQSLPSDDAPGQLAKPLRPGGFEALQGMPIRARTPPPAPPRPEKRVQQQDRRAAELQRKQTERALKDARERERRGRAAVAALEKQVARAERQTAAARATLDRTQEEESRLRADLRKAQDALEQAEKQRREAERMSSGLRN